MAVIATAAIGGMLLAIGRGSDGTQVYTEPELQRYVRDLSRTTAEAPLDDAPHRRLAAWGGPWAKATATATLQPVARPVVSFPQHGRAADVPRITPGLPVLPEVTVIGDAWRCGGEVCVEQWRSLICGAPYTWDCDWALRVIYGGAPGCPNGESGGNPNAVGSEWYEGELWYFVGLWQIATRDPAMIPTLQDPVTNTLEAHWKYLHGGASHWPVCGQ